jgi:serine/threonine protein kinase
VHLDIKPENIAFSLSYNSYVFIDFGLSRMVKEDIGSKTESPFVGSFNFCCDEMLELFVKNSSGYIDLYYNDAFCLKKSLKALKEQFQ